MAKPKSHKQPTKPAKHKTGYRNAAPPAHVPRASHDRRHRNGIRDDTVGWRLARTAGGALGGAVLCAWAASTRTIPKKTAAAVLSAAGAAVALGNDDEAVRDVSLGVATTAFGQLLMLLSDDQLTQLAEASPPANKEKEKEKKLSNADGLPPGALAAAVQRAKQYDAIERAIGQRM